MSHGRTDGRTDRHLDTLGSCRSQKSWVYILIEYRPKEKIKHFTNISTLCRCSATSPDRQTCTGPGHTVLELSEGIWSEAEDNPFSDHFKVYIHSCSNDDFSGVLMRIYKENIENIYF